MNLPHSFILEPRLVQFRVFSMPLNYRDVGDAASIAVAPQPAFPLRSGSEPRSGQGIKRTLRAGLEIGLQRLRVLPCRGGRTIVTSTKSPAELTGEFWLSPQMNTNLNHLLARWGIALYEMGCLGRRCVADRPDRLALNIGSLDQYA
jgi:hypothetical protein